MFPLQDHTGGVRQTKIGLLKYACKSFLICSALYSQYVHICFLLPDTVASDCVCGSGLCKETFRARRSEEVEVETPVKKEKQRYRQKGSWGENEGWWKGEARGGEGGDSCTGKFNHLHLHLLWTLSHPPHPFLLASLLFVASTLSFLHYPVLVTHHSAPCFILFSFHFLLSLHFSWVLLFHSFYTPYAPPWFGCFPSLFTSSHPLPIFLFSSAIRPFLLKPTFQ